MESINPATDEKLQSWEVMDDKTVDGIIDASHEASLAWRRTSFAERSELLHKAAGILKDKREEFAELMSKEMGKVLKQALAEIDKCAGACEYYADESADFLAPEAIETDASHSGIVYRPLGTVLAVMPWNFPFWQVFRFAAPGLMAGNTALLKHASNVTGCALAIESVFRDAGFPEHAFRSLIIGSDAVARVIENPKVHAVTLTGSTPAGKAVAAKAGEMLKKSVLELGGSDPYVVLDDADMESTVKTCVDSRLNNGGQTCIAAKRFIVVESRLEEFTRAVIEEMKSRVMGDPMDEDSDIGPQARSDLRDELHQQVKKSVEKGATLALGGEIPDKPGAWYPPTVLTGVKPGMPAYDEETFGPVAAIIAARDEDEAIRIANDTSFGLGAAVFTQDLERGQKLAENELQAGACFVNALVKSDPRLPFGGIKESGYGRELSYLGIREFVNAKTIYVA